MMRTWLPYSLLLVVTGCGSVHEAPDVDASNIDMIDAGGGIDGADSVILTVNQSGQGSGLVTTVAASAGNVSGIHCGDDCSESYPRGAMVSLHAEPSSVSGFVGWSGGGCTGTDDCLVLLDAAKLVIAEFRMNACPPDTTVCDQVTGDVITCDHAGNVSVTHCLLGCNDTELRCHDLKPSNGLAAQLDMTTAAAAADLPAGTIINTGAGSIALPGGTTLALGSQLVTQTGGPSIRVFIVKSLVMNDVTVTGPHALAFVSDGDIQVRGTISVRATGAAGGPGAAASCPNQAQGQGRPSLSNPGNTWFGGGGGGGFATAGGKGGDAIASFPPDTSTGGSASSVVTLGTLTPLRGGCGGGYSQDDGAVVRTVGGAGGGAIQLVSRTAITLSANGTAIARIDVGGGGGPAGDKTGASDGGGGGGGSGGGVLLEAPLVNVAGTGVIVAANGGGGGGACTAAGQDGRLSDVPATGGVCNFNNQSAGGPGAAGNALATAGTDAAGDSMTAAGGGGGGIGYLRVNSATGTFAASDGAKISATLSVGTAGHR